MRRYVFFRIDEDGCRVLINSAIMDEEESRRAAKNFAEIFGPSVSMFVEVEF
jgi:hypothetical protein